jgi:hypothetical protein
MKNRKTLIKLKKFILRIKNLSNTELLEEYKKSNADIDYTYEAGFSNNIEYERNSILKELILNRMQIGYNKMDMYLKNISNKPPINREPKPTPAPPPKKGN